MENKIYRIITSEEYSTLLEKLEDKNFKAQELSNFLIIDNNERKHMKTYTAIDNTTGDLWTEEFSSFEHAIEYLEGIIQVDEVHAMYKERSNWLEKFEKQKNKCAHCKKEFPFNQMHADHIKPWSLGGKTEPNNCQILCQSCNAKKSDNY